jgi:hypothetical protein
MREIKFGKLLLPFMRSESSFLHLICKNIKVTTCETVHLPVALYRSETCFSHYGINIDSECYRTGWWGEYVDVRGY